MGSGKVLVNFGLVKETNKSQWEKKLPESQGLNSSEGEGGDLGPEPTKWITFITETKEREANRGRAGGPQGSDNSTRPKFPSGYGPCAVEEGYVSTEVKKATSNLLAKLARRLKDQQKV